MEVDICKTCFKKHGFIVEPPESPDELGFAQTANEKNLRDKIIDILSDLDVVFQE